MLVIAHLALVPLIRIRFVVTNGLAERPVTPDPGRRVGLVFPAVGAAAV